MVRAGAAGVSNHEGSRTRHLGTASWFETRLRRPHHEATGKSSRNPIGRKAGTLGLLALILAASLPAAAEDGVLETIDYPGGAPVEATYGALRFVIDQVKGEYDYLYMRAQAFRGAKRVFVMQVCCNRKTATLTLLKTRHYGPAAVLQSLHGKCCADSYVALPITPTRWVVREGDYSDGDMGYRFEDLDGDGAPELIGTDAQFRLLELYPSFEMGRFAPITVRKMDGEHLATVTADPRYRHPVADSLAVLEAHAKAVPADGRDNSFLAAWFATKVRLGDGQAGWARLVQSYTSHETYMCHLPMAFAPCRKEHEMMGDVPAIVRRHLLLRGYIADEHAYPLPPGSAGPKP